MRVADFITHEIHRSADGRHRVTTPHGVTLAVMGTIEQAERWVLEAKGVREPGRRRGVSRRSARVSLDGPQDNLVRGVLSGQYMVPRGYL